MLRSATLLSVALFLSGSALAQERRAEVTATYNGLYLPANPDAKRTAFTYGYAHRAEWLKKVHPNVVGSRDNSPAVGILDWVVPAEEFGTGGMDREFRTYCAEAPVPVTAGLTYKFQVLPPDLPEAYKLAETDAGKAEAYRRSLYIRELFGRYYVGALADPKAAKAFQIALWEIIHEPVWAADKAPPLDLDQGSFTAAKEQENPESVSLARQYLASLTGNDNVFYENPDLAGRELVWMKGLVSPLASNAVAQSQFALQYVKGGAARTAIAPQNVGGGLGVPLGGGGMGGGGGGMFAGGGGGAGVFAGGGGGFGGGFGGGGSPPTQPPITTPPTVPPINQPPTNPPDGTNPVPAPAGLVLGLIAVGAFVGRRAFVRRAQNAQA